MSLRSVSVIALIGLLLGIALSLTGQRNKRTMVESHNVPDTCPVTKAAQQPFIPPLRDE